MTSVMCLLEVWEYLFFTEQAFMLEAFDKYAINFNVTTKYKDILGWSVSTNWSTDWA